MAIDYLNKNGLSYFWSKLKAYFAQKATTLAGYGITDAKLENGTITLGSNSITPLTSVPSHNQASNTITAMTGYSKSSSTSAISTSDTLNQAIGKLEKSIDDADISNVVHRTGDEDIYGIKTFFGDPDNDANACNVLFRQKGFSRGDVVSHNTFWSIQCLDETNIPFDNTGNGNHGRIGNLQCMLTRSNVVEFALVAYENTYGTDNRGVLAVGYDKANSESYTRAPTPSSASSDSDAIATTEWVRDATGDFACNAATASKLKTARSLKVALGSTAAVTFDGSAAQNSIPVSGTLAVANGGTGSSTKNFVDLSTAQTVAGTKTFNSKILAPHVAGKNGDSGELYLSAQSSDSKGAWIGVYGKTRAAIPGFVRIAACTEGNEKQLQCKPDGGLTWNGQTIQTSSDERIKTPIEAISDDVLDGWEGVSWGQFKFLADVAEKGDAARLHVGLVAQQVDRSFKSAGSDILGYGILCHEDVDESMHDLWMVRYTEALCMEAAYQRRENARLKKRVADLEERLAVLELRLGSA